jgi:hypothetical protein
VGLSLHFLGISVSVTRQHTTFNMLPDPQAINGDHEFDSVGSRSSFAQALPGTPSVFSRTTRSSSSTAWGPGTHAGRALRAIGVAMIDGAVVMTAKVWITRQKSIVGNQERLFAFPASALRAICVNLVELTRFANCRFGHSEGD